MVVNDITERVRAEGELLEAKDAAEAATRGLVGQTVGSRVLLVIPAEEGYGEQGSPPDIQGGDTLVFVVDILAAY